MAAFFDNRLDQSFKTTRDPAPHAGYNYTQFSSGQVSLTGFFDDRWSPDYQFLVNFPMGLTPTSSGWKLVAWLRPLAEFAAPSNAYDFAIEPGREYTFEARLGRRGSWQAGLTNNVRLAIFWRGGSPTAYSTIAWPNSSSPGTVFTTSGIAPAGATGAYLTIQAEFTGDPVSANCSIAVIDASFAPTGVPAKGGATEASIATTSRLGIVGDVYSRSREKIKLRLAEPDPQLLSGERVELAAAATTASAVTWDWRQVSGPEVALEVRGNTADFIAPDVDRPTPVRIAVYAGSTDGRNRSDWGYFDLTIRPSPSRFRLTAADPFAPLSPKIVGYERGKREIWNDVVPPPTYTADPRYPVEVVDLGIRPDDVQFSTTPPARCAAGGIYVDPVTGDVFRNFGPGYNETDETMGAPRVDTYWLNPATGDILRWRDEG